MNTEQQFNDAYLKAQPLEAQAIFHTTAPGSSAREAALTAFKAKWDAVGGNKPFIIDPQIMLMGYPGWENQVFFLPPFYVMATRLAQGETWVPAYGQDPLQAGPGNAIGDEIPYDPNNPPAGSVIVMNPLTCDLATALPPTAVPVPPPVPKPVFTGPFVGPEFPAMSKLKGFICYFALPAANYPVPIGYETNETGTLLELRWYVTFATTVRYFTAKENPQ